MRIVLFSSFCEVDYFRRPELFGGYHTDDDYWKLRHIFMSHQHPIDPTHFHPQLGWSQAPVTDDNPLGLDSVNANRLSSPGKKILFYGDSFVRGARGVNTKITEYLASRLDDFTTVDLSNGGDGLDQMFLMFLLSYAKAGNPVVIFGVLVDDDFDRSILNIRDAPKPRLALCRGKLVFPGVLNPQPLKDYLRASPPQIKSYLFRLLFQGLGRKSRLYQDLLTKKQEKTALNSAIIAELHRICQDKNYPLLFVLFYCEESLTRVTWREEFIKTTLKQHNIPYLDTKSLLAQHAQKHNRHEAAYYIQEGKEEGHHNDLANIVISEALLEFLSKKLTQDPFGEHSWAN